MFHFICTVKEEVIVEADSAEEAAELIKDAYKHDYTLLLPNGKRFLLGYLVSI